MSDEPETPETPAVPETPAPAEPAPAEAPAPAPAEPAPAKAPAERKEPSRTGLFDKVALAPFYLFALVVGWGVASFFAGNGFACPSWLRCLSLWVFALGVVWTVAFRARVAKPVGYVAGFVLLFLLVAIFMPHGTFEERTARQKLDAAVADWRAQGYDLSVASLAMEKQDDGSYAGRAMLRSGRQTFEFDLTAGGAETADGYAVKVGDLDPATNDRLAAILRLADRLPPPPAEEEPAEPAAEPAAE